MRLPNAEHTFRPWRIHEITRDFRLEDVWALPTPGGPDDFPRLMHEMLSFDPEKTMWPVRMLFAIRGVLGGIFRWDDVGYESDRPTLKDRLPADLRDGPSGSGFNTGPFTPLYMTENEWAAEVVNRTVHGVIHLGWVPDPAGGYRGQMAILVKPNGLLGTCYMAAIAPFRYLIVYPGMLRELGRKWRRSPKAEAPRHGVDKLGDK